MEKVGIIGYGNMGKAIAESIKAKYSVCVFDKDKNKIFALKDIIAVDAPGALVNQSEIIILAIKPQDFEPVLNKIKDNLQGQLVVSIAAGITTEYIQRILGKVRVVRVMPNFAVKVGQSTTSICKGAFASNEDLKFVARLFKYLGAVFIFPENKMDVATAIAGSGPGFWCDLVKDKPKNEWEKYSQDHFIPDLISAAEKGGLGKEARLFAELTTKGTLAIVKVLGIAPDALIEKISSKGGTTQAGLDVLHSGGSLNDAVRAAIKRADELGKRG